MGRRSTLLIFCFIFVLFAPFYAFSQAKITLFEPKDRTIIKDNRIMISGQLSGAKDIDINGTNVELEKGNSFSALGLLKPGKNVILVSAVASDKEKVQKKIRVLRILTFEDFEVQYSDKEHWAKSNVLTLATIGIIEGYPGDIFDPAKPISRGELATWLARARNLKTFIPKEDVYFDVPKEHWRAPYIKAVIDAELMKPIENDKFGIDSPIERWAVVEIFNKAFGFKMPQTKKKGRFADVPADSKYFNAVYIAYYNGLINGYPGSQKTFAPEINMKRSEAAMLFTGIPRMKALKASLYDFETEYNYLKLCKIGTKPLVKNGNIDPSSIQAVTGGGIRISADIKDAQGSEEVSQVWVDLTSISGPNNAKMSVGQDGKYELKIFVSSEVSPGEKKFTIKALDKTGLEGQALVKFNIIGNK